MSASYTSTAFVPDDLIAGNADELIGVKITLVSGQNLKRGALLGKITAGGKYTLSASAAGDGSQTPDLILAEDCDASAGDKPGLAYKRGDFIADVITLGVGHTLASIDEGLRGKGIFLISRVRA